MNQKFLFWAGALAATGFGINFILRRHETVLGDIGGIRLVSRKPKFGFVELRILGSWGMLGQPYIFGRDYPPQRFIPRVTDWAAKTLGHDAGTQLVAASRKNLDNLLGI